MESIIEGLKRWQVAIDNLEEVTQVAAFALKSSECVAPTPALLIKALVSARQDDNWGALVGFLPRIYPMNLLKDKAISTGIV